eukprot:364285-Chlamydomonas_euryale.AAC.1
MAPYPKLRMHGSVSTTPYAWLHIHNSASATTQTFAAACRRVPASHLPCCASALPRTCPDPLVHTPCIPAPLRPAAAAGAALLQAPVTLARCADDGELLCTPPRSIGGTRLLSCGRLLTR